MRLEVFLLPSGRPFLDLIFAGFPKWITPGEELFAESFKMCAGGSFNIAAACNRLGLEVGLCAHLGKDFSSDFIRLAARQEHLTTDYFIEHDEPLNAITVSVSRSDDRAFISYVDEPPPFREDDLPEHGVPHIIFVPGLPEKPAALFDYLDKMKKAGSILACDCQHVERTIMDPEVGEFISRMDLFLANEKESAVLTGRADPERSAAILGKYSKEVVIKIGKRGALAFEGGLIFKERAISVKAVDTTGAGDGFTAGYLFAKLEGMEEERRLRLANVVGGIVASNLGGWQAAPTIDEVLKMEKKYYG